MKETLKKSVTPSQAIGLSFFVIVFVVATYASQKYQAELTTLIESYGVFGPFLYTLIGFLATVFAPINMTFLIPVASTVFGPFAAALFSILGWTAGSLTAFFIAKRYGRPLVSRFAKLDKIEEWQAIIPERNLFIWVLLMRMAVPADVLSYALGLFVHMGYRSYTIATCIGLTPFAFIFAYASTLAVPFMIGALSLAVVSSVIGMWWALQKIRQKRVTEES